MVWVNCGGSLEQCWKEDETLQKPVDPSRNVRIPDTFSIDLESSVSARHLRLNVALPSAPEPPDGYRALYLLDGDTYFATAVEAVRANGNAPDVIVIGIGYPDTPEFVEASMDRHGPLPPELGLSPFIMAVTRERMFDLSLPMTEAELKSWALPVYPQQSSDLGGVDAFLATLELDIKPRIAALAKINPQGTALFGHSLAGLAVLRALFTRPDLVRTFIAASPSIWWNSCSVLQAEKHFAELVEQHGADPRILITMGADESAPPKQAVPGISAADAAALISRANMVDNAQQLVNRLKCLSGGSSFEVADYALFQDQGHGISVWPAIGRAVEFAFQR